MRTLVTGAHGQVGFELMRRAPDNFEVQGFGSDTLDITDIDQVRNVVEALKPQLIINAAAYTAVDKAESDSDRAWAVNRDGVANLASIAAEQEIPVLHISTDYVFTGNATEAYQESDPTGPTGVYGASKLAGEEVLSATCRQHIVLRTSWVFGAHGSNFVKTMLRLGNERDHLSIVADQHGCPTSAASIADALWQIAQQYSKGQDLLWGIYHFSGAPACTWFDFAEEIFFQAHSMGLIKTCPKIIPIGTADFPTPASRPEWSVMNCTKFKNEFGIWFTPWKVDLQLVLQELDEYK